MAGLLYKTRGNSTLQGKPRVYFCCHPDDFDVFFEEISDEILEKQNCSIWYKDNFSLEYDTQFFDDLSQMQLFILPVTTKFLVTDNMALKEEFKFAIDKHIPVLPLMQESGLDMLFNEKCGDLQFLDKNNNDSTAISYDEKLEKYLSSVLIGDELAEKIRDAFDAYIFLSYRKKDRKHAQDLMKLIHKNDFCRDIAIWYDEFLTPGENFNESIKTALQKSGLFVLAVTPNLVNEENYIMTTEYPMAKEEGKPILPAEMVETDKDELSKKYKDIPSCTDAHDEKWFSETLLNSIQKIAIKEKDNSPEHNFFIGLAYLGGVDVEVDKERAVSLITGAAEAGLPEAIEKLVSMYNTGEGVERNYYTAIKWQEKVVDIYTARYEQDDNEENYHNLFRSIINLGDSLYDVRKLSKAKATYTKLLTLASSKNFQYDLSICYDKLGNISYLEGDFTETGVYYLKSFEIREKIVKETDTIEARSGLALSYSKTGNVFKARGSLGSAKWCYFKSLDIREIIVKETDTIEARHNLAVSYESLGNISKYESKLTEAKEYYLKSFNIFEIIANETGTIEARCDLSRSYDDLGIVYESEGNLTEAKEYYLKSLNIREIIANETNTIGARSSLAVSYDNLGIVYESEGNLTEAKEYYLKSLNIQEIIANETNTIGARRGLAISYTYLGNISKSEGDLAEAKEYFKKALNISETLEDSINTIVTCRTLSTCYANLGDISKSEGNLTEAKEYYLKSLDICTDPAYKTNTIEARRDLAVSYDNLGKISKLEGNLAKAKEYYLKSLDISETIAKETDMIEARSDLSICYEKLGYISKSEGNLAEAKEYFKKDLNITKTIADETNTIEAHRNLSMCYDKLGYISKSEGNLAEAKGYYLKSLNIKEFIANETGTRVARRDLSICYDKLGYISESEGNSIEAKDYYQKSINIRKLISSAEIN